MLQMRFISYRSVVAYFPAVDAALAIGTNIETNTQAPSHTFSHLLTPSPSGRTLRPTRRHSLPRPSASRTPPCSAHSPTPPCAARTSRALPGHFAAPSHTFSHLLTPSRGALLVRVGLVLWRRVRLRQQLLLRRAEARVREFAVQRDNEPRRVRRVVRRRRRRRRRRRSAQWR